jgi:hypothetical protein
MKRRRTISVRPRKEDCRGPKVYCVAKEEMEMETDERCAELEEDRRKRIEHDI